MITQHVGGPDAASGFSPIAGRRSARAGTRSGSVGLRTWSSGAPGSSAGRTPRTGRQRAGCRFACCRRSAVSWRRTSAGHPSLQSDLSSVPRPGVSPISGYRPILTSRRLPANRYWWCSCSVSPSSPVTFQYHLKWRNLEPISGPVSRQFPLQNGGISWSAVRRAERPAP